MKPDQLKTRKSRKVLELNQTKSKKTMDRQPPQRYSKQTQINTSKAQATHLALEHKVRLPLTTISNVWIRKRGYNSSGVM